MSQMFNGSKFNQDISNWNVSNINDMEFMFSYSDFQQDISKWDVSNVERMKDLFYETKFNKNIDDWNICKVKGYIYFFDVLRSDIPYWAEFRTQKERVIAYEKYHLNKKLNSKVEINIKNAINKTNKI